MSRGDDDEQRRYERSRVALGLHPGYHEDDDDDDEKRRDDVRKTKVLERQVALLTTQVSDLRKRLAASEDTVDNLRIELDVLRELTETMPPSSSSAAAARSGPMTAINFGMPAIDPALHATRKGVVRKGATLLTDPPAATR